MSKWSPGAASKDQMVSYDQETNPISATSSYSQNISNGEHSIILTCPVVFARNANHENNNTQDCIWSPTIVINETNDA